MLKKSSRRSCNHSEVSQNVSTVRCEVEGHDHKDQEVPTNVGTIRFEVSIRRTTEAKEHAHEEAFSQEVTEAPSSMATLKKPNPTKPKPELKHLFGERWGKEETKTCKLMQKYL